MKKIERHEQELLNALRVSNRMNLADAINLLHVSESTVRRLFSRLEASGQVIRTYGGIQLVTENAMDYSYEQVENYNVEQKTKIAAYCAEMVQNGDIIFLDSGTTLAHMSSILAQKLEHKEISQITIFTNSLVNLNILSKVTEVNLIGGQYRANRKDFCGYMAEETVKSLHFTKCFLGTDGYSIHSGFTATDFLTARLNELVLQASNERIVLADASKFRSSTIVSYSKNQTISTVVTDDFLEEAIKNSIEMRGTAIHYV